VSKTTESVPTVGLFATCLMNLFRPAVGFAAVKLLEAAGCRVAVPTAQTCCGQPAFNSGDYDTTRALARAVIELFEPYDYLVAPSGSCLATIKNDYPTLLADDGTWAARAHRLAGRSHELLSFLADVRGLTPVDARYAGTATYHDSCSGLRGLGIKQQPRRLLTAVDGLELREMADSEVCCGFGGTFCVKYPAISQKMVDDKLASIDASGAGILLGGDLGCLLNIAGRLQRLGKPVRVFHTAEMLAGMADGPAIGEAGQAKDGR
jgi:L-lactate dehydrogenase complex protein LldE